MQIYLWNARISQSLYWPLHMLEITYRNSMSDMLAQKYGKNWHSNPEFHKILVPKDLKILKEVCQKQLATRKVKFISADPVIADLNFGFWTALATKHYKISLHWETKTIHNVFPNRPSNIKFAKITSMLDTSRSLRNRISHHEPLISMNLNDRFNEIMNLIAWINSETAWYVDQHSDFLNVLQSRPHNPSVTPR